MYNIRHISCLSIDQVSLKTKSCDCFLQNEAITSLYSVAVQPQLIISRKRETWTIMMAVISFCLFLGLFILKKKENWSKEKWVTLEASIETLHSVLCFFVWILSSSSKRSLSSSASASSSLFYHSNIDQFYRYLL